MSIITGWDIGSGKPRPFPVVQPFEITLAKAWPTAPGPVGPRGTSFRIWNFHPALVVVFEFYKRVRLDMDPGGVPAPFPEGQMIGSLAAITTVKSGNLHRPIHERIVLPPADLFLDGGNLNDGCEINSGLQGITFVPTVSILGPCDHDLVATVRVMQKNALGCVELAEKLAAAIEIEPVRPIDFST